MSGKKILIVDDSGVILNALSAKLKGQGYETFTAEDGAAAVGIVRKEKLDLILLDLGFPPDVAAGGGPFQDGLSLIQWLRRMDEAKHIPIIVITASKDPDHEKRSLAAGAIGFFPKPIDTEQLLAAIQQVLGKTS